MADSKQFLKDEPEEFRLNRYYYAVEVTSLVATLFFGVVIYSFKQFFPWVRYPLLFFINCMATFSLQGIFFILRERFKKNIFFTLARYVFVSFFIVAIYATGGIFSLLIFLLVFPLVVSAVDLDARATRNIGITVTTLLGLMIFADPEYLADPIIVFRHLINVSLFGLIAYYIYKIIKETLREKFEKEEAKRKFMEVMELDKLKSDFLTVAQHQLRTPLSGARWGLDNLLSDSSLQNKMSDTLKQVYGKVGDAILIVNEMLKTAELSASGFKLVRDPVNLGALVAEILVELEYLVQKKSVSVRFKRTDDFIVHGDPKLLRSAITNVIDNGIRYSPGGTVSIAIGSRDNSVELQVKDSGIGIKPEDLPYVFERFYRSKDAISMEPNESGVGLYITKKIIELHAGTINVGSSPSGGTVVLIRLPAKNEPSI